MKDPLSAFLVKSKAELELIDLFQQRRNIARFGAGAHLPRPNGTGALYYQHESEEYDQDADDASLSKTLTWAHIMQSELGQVLATDDPEAIRRGLFHVIAVAFGWAVAVNEDEDSDAVDAGALQ